MLSLSIHFIRAGVIAGAVGAAGVARAQEPPLAPTQLPSAESFTVFVKAVPVGTEQISVTRGAGGWTIVSSGRMGAPIDISARRVQVRYNEDWKPIELTVDATVRGQLLSIQTVVTDGTAQTHTVNGGQSTDRTDPIAADAVLLPSPFWGPFEALAARLKSAAPGTTIPAYAPPLTFWTSVGRSTTDKVQAASR